MRRLHFNGFTIKGRFYQCYQTILIGNGKDWVGKGSVVRLQRISSRALNNRAIGNQPLGVGTWVGNDTAIIVDRYGAIIFRLIWAMSFQSDEFIFGFSVNYDTSRSSGNVNPTLGYHEIEEVGLIDINNNIHRHIRNSIAVSLAAADYSKHQNQDI